MLVVVVGITGTVVVLLFEVVEAVVELDRDEEVDVIRVVGVMSSPTIILAHPAIQKPKPHTHKIITAKTAGVQIQKLMRFIFAPKYYYYTLLC